MVSMTKQELKDLLIAAGYIEYSTISSAWTKEGRYTLNHGEYSRPEYIIRKEKCADSYYIYVRYYYYNNTINAPKDGRMSDDAMDSLYEEKAYRSEAARY
jgi:hypothetical protein